MQRSLDGIEHARYYIELQPLLVGCCAEELMATIMELRSAVTDLTQMARMMPTMAQLLLAKYDYSASKASKSRQGDDFKAQLQAFYGNTMDAQHQLRCMLLDVQLPMTLVTGEWYRCWGIDRSVFVNVTGLACGRAVSLDETVWSPFLEPPAVNLLRLRYTAVFLGPCVPTLTFHPNDYLASQAPTCSSTAGTLMADSSMVLLSLCISRSSGTMLVSACLSPRARVLPIDRKDDFPVLLGLNNINDTRNGLLLFKPLEHAFDDSRICFTSVQEAGEIQFKLKLLDSGLEEVKVCVCEIAFAVIRMRSG